MKRKTTLLAALLTALSVPGPVAAQNVLLPPDTPDKSSRPNLGFMPTEPSADSSKTDEPPAAVLPDTSPILPRPAQPSAPVAPAASTRKPYQIKVALSSQTAWTPADFSTIATQLGLSGNAIASTCRIAVNGMLITDKGAQPIESNFLNSVTVGYDGTVSNAMLNAYAVCTSAPKPAPHSYMQKVGNKFTISLGSAFCQAAKPFRGTVRQLVLTHSATGDSCAYLP